MDGLKDLVPFCKHVIESWLELICALRSTVVCGILQAVIKETEQRLPEESSMSEKDCSIAIKRTSALLVETSSLSQVLAVGVYIQLQLKRKLQISPSEQDVEEDSILTFWCYAQLCAGATYLHSTSDVLKPQPWGTNVITNII